MQEWRDSQVTVRVHVVGVGLDQMERNAMTCIAEVSGGKYFDVDSANRFAEVMNQASEAIEEPGGKPNPYKPHFKYALKIKARDKEGRAYIAAGKLF